MMKILQLGKAYPPVNFGGVDIYIKSLKQGTHNFVGNTFNRVSGKRFTQNHIVLEVPANKNLINVLNMIGNGVLTANDYVPDVSRPAVKIITSGSLVRVFDSNLYANIQEKPVYSSENIQLITN